MRRVLRILGLGAYVLALAFIGAVVIVFVEQKAGRTGLVILLVILVPFWLWLLGPGGVGKKPKQ